MSSSQSSELLLSNDVLLALSSKFSVLPNCGVETGVGTRISLEGGRIPFLSILEEQLGTPSKIHSPITLFQTLVRFCTKSFGMSLDFVGLSCSNVAFRAAVRDWYNCTCELKIG